MQLSSQRQKRQSMQNSSNYSAVQLDTSRVIEQINRSGKLSRKQHLHLMTALLSNAVNDRNERIRISQILDAAKAREIEMVN